MKTVAPSDVGTDLTVELVRNGMPVRRNCKLLGIAGGDAHLFSETWLEPGIEVKIHFTMVSLSGVVVYSKGKQAGYRVSVHLDTGTDRVRREPRFPIQFHGIATVFDDEKAVVVPALLTDISRSGLGMQLEVAAPVDAMICIETESFVVSGEVRFCEEQSEGKYQVGIEVSDVFEGHGRNQDSVLGVIRRGLFRS